MSGLTQTGPILLLSVGMLMCACSTGKNSGSAIPSNGEVPVATPRMERLSEADRGAIIRSEELIGNRAVGVIPKAVAYRMSGDYADKVPIMISPDGEVQSYPAPTDLVGGTPLELADGWWLDRRGVGQGSVFTRYTYAEYAALPQAPTPKELLEAVIPGAKVTAVMRLPMTMREAEADTAAVNAFIRAQQGR